MRAEAVLLLLLEAGSPPGPDCRVGALEGAVEGGEAVKRRNVAGEEDERVVLLVDLGARVGRSLTAEREKRERKRMRRLRWIIRALRK